MIQILKTISSKPLTSDDVDQLDDTLKRVISLTSSSNACHEKPNTLNDQSLLKPFAYDYFDLLNEDLQDFISNKSSTKAFGHQFYLTTIPTSNYFLEHPKLVENRLPLTTFSSDDFHFLDESL